jgi:hypothetical protein
MTKTWARRLAHSLSVLILAATAWFALVMGAVP